MVIARIEPCTLNTLYCNHTRHLLSSKSQTLAYHATMVILFKACCKSISDCLLLTSGLASHSSGGGGGVVIALVTYAMETSISSGSVCHFSQAKSSSFWFVKKNEISIVLNMLFSTLLTDSPSLSIYRCHYCIFGCLSGFPRKQKWKQHTWWDFHRRDGALRSYHSETSGFRSWWDNIRLAFWRWLTVA